MNLKNLYLSCILGLSSLSAPLFAESDNSAFIAAERLRAAIEISPEETWTIDAAADEDLTLPIGKVLNQRNSQWCWAFSTFHTLRTYYLHAAQLGEAETAWRDAIEAIDSQEKFWSYMQRRRATGQTGVPAWFIQHFVKDGLPAQPWVGSYTRGVALTQDYGRVIAGFLPEAALATEIKPLAGSVQKIRDNLRRGIPSAWCGSGHCVTIYGGRFKDGVATSYKIADSIGARTYEATASRMNSLLEYFLTYGS